MSDKAQSIPAGNEPFTTTDAELALTLITAGCSFAKPENGGPAQQHYTPDVCRNRWVTRRDAKGHPTRIPLLSHDPQTPEQFEISVIRAQALKIPGVVTYYFERDATFKEAMAMHDALAKEAHLAELQTRQMEIPKFHTLTETQMVVVVCFVRRRNEREIEGYKWVRPPNLAIGDLSRKTTPTGAADQTEQMNYTMNGSGRIWSLNLSNEKRATIMPDGKPFIHQKPKA